MIPTKSEIIEYFKDAKIINCLLLGIYEPIIDSIFLDKEDNEYWCNALNSQDKILLWQNGNYAKIRENGKDTYIKIPISEIKNCKNDKELVELVRSIAENY